MSKKTVFYGLFWLAVALTIHYFTLPDPISRLQVPHKFQIYRDVDHVPRVVAKDKESLFFALGFAEAEDRLWTLKVKKMLVEGRTAQMFGSETLEMDLEMRNYAFL